MDENLKAFCDEIEDILIQIEDTLLHLEDYPGNEDLIHELFRLVHTVKGSSGMFGFKKLVSFAHKLETLMGRVRDHFLDIDREMLSLLLKARDHLQVLVDLVLNRYTPGNGNPELHEIDQIEDDLVDQIYMFIGLSNIPIEHQQNYRPAVSAAPIDGHRYSIHIIPSTQVLCEGMDPISFISYLEDLGTVNDITINDTRMPLLDELSFDHCYLDFTILFTSTITESEVLHAFLFLQESAKITVTQETSLTGSSKLASDTDSTPDHSDTQSIEEYNPAQGPIKERDAKNTHEKQKTSSTQLEETVRISAKKLEALINLVGELVISNANTHLLAKNRDTDALLESTENMLDLVENIRDTTLSLRMVPIAHTFGRFKRVVREVSHSLNKDISLIIQGGETELDKTVVDKLNDPLVHLIRNSIDHGIESKEQRIAHGKPEKGTILLNAYHDSGNIVIEITDDGQGLNREKILNKAIENGVIQENVVLTDREVHQLIFAPGFSTAEEVTDLSGRGVGMDVVNRNIESLRGHIDVLSVEGKGCRFSIRLPLTLAIIDGFLVQVDNLYYVIPLDLVDECVDFSEVSNTTYINSHFINLRGEILPYMRLKDVFRIKNDHFVEQTKSTKENIVIIRNGGKKAGLAIDRLLGEYQTVVKPLGKIFNNMKGLSGATILGSGEVAMIVDVVALVELATLQAKKDREVKAVS